MADSDAASAQAARQNLIPPGLGTAEPEPIDGASYRRARRTLADATETYHGVGLHSGAAAWVRILPAPSGAGLVFVDAATGQEVPALAENVCDTTRCTQLGRGGVVIQTVEHVLSALAGLGVDDARIEVDGGELPAADGSAAPFAQMIRNAGVVERNGFVEPLVLTEPVDIGDGRGGSIRLEPARETSYSVTLEYPKHPYIGTQTASFGISSYLSEIAAARTFGFLAEIDTLRAHGLALGASMDNALVLGDDAYVNERRFENEMARHKILDLIGDLSLLGRPIVAEVVAIRPGHELNTRLAALLAGKQS